MRPSNILDKRLESSDLDIKITEFDVLCDRILQMSEESVLPDDMNQTAELLEYLVDAADHVCNALFEQDTTSSEPLQDYFLKKMDVLQEKIRINLEVYFYAHQIENILSVPNDREVHTCH